MIAKVESILFGYNVGLYMEIYVNIYIYIAYNSINIFVYSKSLYTRSLNNFCLAGFLTLQKLKK